MNSKQRTGTWLCWMFGHKFVHTLQEQRYEEGIINTIRTPTLTNHCIRCGADKETSMIPKIGGGDENN